MSDNLLDKASILLTPTAYRDGGMLSVKPNENLYGSELVTNGDFATDSDWSLQSSASISQNKLIVSNAAQNTTIATQSSVAPTQKPCKLQFDIVVNTGSFRILLGSSGTSTTVTESGTYTLYETSGNFGTLTLQARDGGFDGSIDNVSVKEVTTATNTPRIDYSTGEKAFLLEPQSTNLITQSELFSDIIWVNYRSSISPNTTISPDGTLNSDKLIDTSDSGTHAIEERIFSLSSGSQYTYSFFAKANEIKQVGLLGSNPSQGSIFDLENGVVYGDFISAPNSSKIENFGNGWYRCSITTTLTSTDSKFGIYLAKNGSTNYTGNGTDGLYIFGAMLEQQSYATSYIPTSGATATRNQELCNNATPVINSEEGTLYAEISALADDGTNRGIALSDGTTLNRVNILFGTGSNKIRTIVKSNTSNSFDKEYTVTSTLNYHKIAIKYKENDFALWIDGVERFTDTSGSSPIGLSKLAFNIGSVGNLNFYGNTKGLKYYPKALADVQLEDLTTI